MKKNMNQPAVAEEKVAKVVGHTDNTIVLGVIDDQQKPAAADSFDYTTVYASLQCGNVYTKEAREAVSAWNTKARGTDASVKYPKVSVQTLDGRIIKLSYANKGQYAKLTHEQLSMVDAFFKEKDTAEISRKTIHFLLMQINSTLPKERKMLLDKEIEHGLADCLRGRKMVGFSYQRRLSDIENVLVRTMYAVINKKQLSVVYKGL